MGSTRRLVALVAATFCGCGNEANTQCFAPALVATVCTVTSKQLAGARLEIPAGALARDTTIVLSRGTEDLTGRELSASAVVVMTPEPELSADVRLSIPVDGVGADDHVSIVGVTSGLTFEVEPDRVALNAARSLATFRIQHLGEFQARRRVRCGGGDSCAEGFTCELGECRDQEAKPCPAQCPINSACRDAGPCISTPSTCSASYECPIGFMCAESRCTIPEKPVCGESVCRAPSTCVGVPPNYYRCVVNGPAPEQGNPLQCSSNAECAAASRSECRDEFCR
jgi:hypothetical protein